MASRPDRGPRILVTDGEQRSTLAVVRSLGRAGYEVEVSAASRRPLAGASRFCSFVHLSPDPSAGIEYTHALAEIVRRAGIEVLIPMTDVSTALALSLRERRGNLVIPFPGEETWNAASDKRYLVEVAEKLGVPVPRQCVVDGPEEQSEAISWAGEVGYPVMVKPHRSAVAGEAGIEKLGVEIAASGVELSTLLKALPASAYPVLVQERIMGAGLAGFFLAIEGEPIASFAHRRLREKPPTGGVSVVCQSVALRADIRRFSEDLLRHFGWSGVAMVEFKEDAETGIPYLMEINGRFWGSTQLAIDAGVDFPALLVERVLGDPAEPFPEYPSHYAIGAESRWFWGDVDHLLWILRARRGYRVDNPQLPGRLGAFLRLLKLWRRGQRYSVARLDDPGPFLRETGQWFRSLLRHR